MITAEHCGAPYLRRAAWLGGKPLLILILPALLNCDSSGAETVMPAWKQKRRALDRCYVRDEFRLFYTLAGDNALSASQREDANKDGVPDKIQDIVRQFVLARRLYVDVFKLRHPFDSPRYTNRVKFFDVFVARLPLEPGGGRNGSAGDAIVNYHHSRDPAGGYEVLTIDLSKDMPCDNLSPAHELFHEFQNGYSLFKNSWYTEGTARWAQYALHKGVGRAGKLPTTEAEQATLYGLSYDAAGFWNALAEASDPAGTFSIPRDLADVRYAGNGRPIIEDLRLHGIGLMKALLEELAATDHRVSRAAGLNPLDWPEARQRATQNNDAIWGATDRVIRRLTGRGLGRPTNSSRRRVEATR